MNICSLYIIKSLGTVHFCLSCAPDSWLIISKDRIIQTTAAPDIKGPGPDLPWYSSLPPTLPSAILSSLLPSLLAVYFPPFLLSSSSCLTHETVLPNSKYYFDLNLLTTHCYQHSTIHTDIDKAFIIISNHSAHNIAWLHNNCKLCVQFYSEFPRILKLCFTFYSHISRTCFGVENILFPQQYCKIFH